MSFVISTPCTFSQKRLQANQSTGLRHASSLQPWEQRGQRSSMLSVSCRDTPSKDKQQGHGGQLHRRDALLAVLLAGAGFAGSGAALAADTEQIVHTDAEWRAMLSPAAYRVLRKAGTELPLSSPLNKEKRTGTYRCGGCGSPLFSSSAKFDSGTGWPSFYEPISGAVAEQLDTSIPFYPRTEVHCSRCGGHIGHVFNDGPPPTGLRYCMNGAALTFEAKA